MVCLLLCLRCIIPVLHTHTQTHDGWLLCEKQEFEDSRDADDAVYDLNGTYLCGER